ncbi:MAG: MFS transporter [Solirubrobacterales bacterium]|nr:MFS transporter [Solirubrobacterales bacterium]
MTNPTSPTSPRRRWFALVLLALAEFVVVLDASIVNIALPSIGRGLHFSLANLSWVVNAYVLTFGGFLLLSGRIADLLGRRRVFVAGLGVFSLASLAGGLAQSEAWLIAARAVQGLGAAMLAPAALSLVTATFSEGAERNKALSIWGAVAGSGAAAGVLLGGVLTSALGWRSVLFVNVPIGMAAILIAPPAALREPGPTRAPRLRPPRSGHGHGRALRPGLRARAGHRHRMGLTPDDRGARGGRVVARHLRRHRAAIDSAVGAVRFLPQPERDPCQRDHVGRGGGDHRPLLLPLALHATGARL